MARHSSQDSEEIRKLFSEIAPLGKTGKFPLGKLVPSDEGETRIAIGSKDGKVVLDLGTPTVWIGFTPEQARDIAAMLVKHAASIG